MQDQCVVCGKPLIRDDIAIHKKLVNRGATEFMCTHCLSEHFKVDEQLVREKIQFFKEQGCTLFSKG